MGSERAVAYFATDAGVDRVFGEAEPRGEEAMSNRMPVDTSIRWVTSMGFIPLVMSPIVKRGKCVIKGQSRFLSVIYRGGAKDLPFAFTLFSLS
jgi:hypothetical protein